MEVDPHIVTREMRGESPKRPYRLGPRATLVKDARGTEGFVADDQQCRRARARHRRTPLDVATTHGHTETAAALREADTNPTPVG